MEKQFELGLQVKDPKEFESQDLEVLLGAVDAAIRKMGGPQGFVILSPQEECKRPYTGPFQALSLLRQFGKILLYNDPTLTYVKH